MTKIPPTEHRLLPQPDHITRWYPQIGVTEAEAVTEFRERFQREPKEYYEVRREITGKDGKQRVELEYWFPWPEGVRG